MNQGHCHENDLHASVAFGVDADKWVCCAGANSQGQLPGVLLALMPEIRHDISKMMRQTDGTIKLFSIVEPQSAGDECQDNEEEGCDT